MQGSKFLKVTGILMIIFGALALVLAIIAIAGISLLAAMRPAHRFLHPCARGRGC